MQRTASLFLHKSLSLNTSEIFIVSLAGAIVLAIIMYVYTGYREKKLKSLAKANNSEYSPIQLQAYERLILLADRIALPNLISRVSQPGISAKEMQLLLTSVIREEYEHNITQQIYVSADAWTAVKNLKEQNQLIINQFANILPPGATGLDLNKMLLEFLMNDKKGALHEVVSEVLSYEAKQIL